MISERLFLRSAPRFAENEATARGVEMRSFKQPEASYRYDGIRSALARRRAQAGGADTDTIRKTGK